MKYNYVCTGIVIFAMFAVATISGCTPDPAKEAAFQKLMNNPTVDGDRIVIFTEQLPKPGCGCSDLSKAQWIKRAIESGDDKGWMLVEQNSDMLVFKLRPEVKAIAEKNGGEALMKALSQFVADKESEIVKLTSVRQESQQIIDKIPDQNMAVHVKALITDIDTRLEILNSLRDKAKVFMNDVNNYAKVESIRQWLNKN